MIKTHLAYWLIGILCGVVITGSVLVLVGGQVPSAPQGPAVQFDVLYDKDAARMLCPGDEMSFILHVDILRPAMIDIAYSIHENVGSVGGPVVTGQNVGNQSRGRDSWGYPEPISFISEDGRFRVPHDLPPGNYVRVATAGTTNNTIPAFYVIPFTVADGCD